MVNRTPNMTEFSKDIHYVNKGKATAIDQFSGETLKGDVKVKT